MAGMYTLLSAYLMLSVFTSLVCEQLLTMWNMVSLHCIAMPKDLYFTAVVFTFFLSSFFFFFWRLISLSSLNRSQTNLDTYRLWLIFGIYPMGGGNTFWDRLWIRQNISLQWNMIATIGKKLVNLQGLPYMPPNLANFGPETAENGWPVLPIHYIFALGGTVSLITWMLYNRRHAIFGTCYAVARAYSLQQQNSGRAHAGLCHAFSLQFFTWTPVSCCKAPLFAAGCAVTLVSAKAVYGRSNPCALGLLVCCHSRSL